MESNILPQNILLEGIKIDLKSVKPGAIYSHNVYDEFGSRIVAADSPLTERIIQSCRERGLRYLYYSKSFEAGANPAGLDLGRNAVSDRTQARARETSRAILEEIAERLQLGQEIDISRAKIIRSRELIEGIIDEVAHNDDAVLITLKELRNYDEYTFVHSANVAVIASTLAVRLGYSRDRIIEIGVGGLLHDIGKAIVGYQIVNKPTELTAEEIKSLMEHPHYGYKIAENNRNITRFQKQAILFHHERPDGMGYPFGFDAEGFIEKVPRDVRLISLCDAFSALTTERAYKPAYTQKRALRIMQNGVHAAFKKHSQFIYDDFRDFIKGIGFMINMGDYIFETEEMVRLNTGEIARILELRKNNSLNPIVRLLTDKKLQPQKREIIIDLENDFSVYVANILDKTSVDTHMLSLRTQAYPTPP
ncbi:MAG TPA: HD domain-containing protein [Spirochaetota bacterium]|nr:MAG: Cyclic di-GMP phosphodiesterase response regulator RpfG [Spirochaetes bacterium ADurb.BinA120]HNU92069.1 HD domain-containing protein [Spirochaetota bacterium]HPI13642.1 HD domain-containing protein [Spirochaetota bacterium]